MRIEGEIKLAFDDVMIRPKRSTLVSRSDVTLERSSLSGTRVDMERSACICS